MPDFSTINKGSRLHVLGRFRMQRYNDSEGNEKVSLDIVASQIAVLKDPYKFD